ncbi:alpha-ketoglutarate-dependent dioxygenase alkB homolog 4-like [Paramacrobiotus metropolitanus]|uniref:alpha-ketoglutarate-dependent dioxygenase alkB homolog 4-like n=1 Tax=Paramacrobiotus metropolitanus TaxID=2943436 RepID=UPI002445E010|nr:alpha-ketoglutarate-dependent dioxygenase alkB homolog 4-like [Paramacrobiotus metropolitanus]
MSIDCLQVYGGKPCACRGVRCCVRCKPDLFAENLSVSRNIADKRGPEGADISDILDDGNCSRNGMKSYINSQSLPHSYSYCYQCHHAFPEVISCSYSSSVRDAEKEASSCTGTKCIHDDTLYSSHAFVLPGLYIWLDFVSENEEEFLVNCIDQRSWVESQSGRRKQDYGPKVNFKKQKLNPASFTGLPGYSRFLLERMISQGDCKDYFSDFRCAELCNLEYTRERGSHIEPHTDDTWLWGDRLVSVNLISDTFLSLIPTDSFAAQSGLPPEIRVHVPMPRRSLFLMMGEARHKWKHAIIPEDICDRRLVMTFRELTPEFLTGAESALGKMVLDTASSFQGV